MGDSLLALAKSIYFELVLLDSLIKVKKKWKQLVIALICD